MALKPIPTPPTGVTLAALGELHRYYEYPNHPTEPMQERLSRVAEWWGERLEAGSQLTDPERFIERFDYFKQADGDTWYRAVAVQALWLDFLGRFPRDSSARPRFRLLFGLVAGPLPARYATRNVPKGKNQKWANLREIRPMIRFALLEAHADRHREYTQRVLTESRKRVNVGLMIPSIPVRMR